jgi:hypothetical protein
MQKPCISRLSECAREDSNLHDLFGSQGVGFRNSDPSSGEGVFADEPAEPVAAENGNLTWRAQWNDLW